MRSHSKFLTSFLRCKKGEPINWSAGRHLSPNLNPLLGQSLILSSSLWGGKKFCSITNPHITFETCLQHFGISSLRYNRNRSLRIGWITRSSWTHFLRISFIQCSEAYFAMSHQVPLPMGANLSASFEPSDCPKLTRSWLQAWTKLPGTR